MNMNKDQLELAVRAGLELLGPESEVAIPAKLTDGVFFLKGLLGGIAQGAISLNSVMQDAPVATPGSKGPPADPKAKRQAKKKASKKKTPAKKK
jgi:hypothetical protein